MNNLENIGQIKSININKMLNKKDAEILSLLMHNAQEKCSVIAKKVNLSKSNVARRIALLEKAGIISGYHAFIDAEKIGLNQAIVFIVFSASQTQREDYIKNIMKIKKVYTVVEMTGKYNLLIGFYYEQNSDKNKIEEQILNAEVIRDFYIINIHTYFSILDYTKEVFSGITAKKVKKYNDKGSNANINIDSLDIDILSCLSQNCRVNSITLANFLKKPRETIQYRIKRLITAGIIAKFQPTVNLFSLGFESFILMIKIRKQTKKQQIREYLASTWRCNTIIETSGLYDILCVIHFKSNEEFRKFENMFILKFSEVIHEYSFELLKQQYKLHWFSKEILK